MRLAYLVRVLIFLENQGWSFFWPKNLFSTHFDPKHLKNTLNTLIKLIHDLKKAQKTILKLKINLKLKIFRTQTCLVGFFEGKKKHLSWTPLIKWNQLRQRSIILMGDINDIYFSLMSGSNYLLFYFLN